MTTRINKSSSGSVLIEFAFSIPILCAILFFMVDAPRYYYIKSKMRHSIHFAVNLIQEFNKIDMEQKMTIKNLKKIFCSSFLNQYSGLQLYKDDLGYSLSANIYYVECINDNKAKILWGWSISNISIGPNNSSGNFLTSGANKNSNVNYNDSYSDPESIYNKNGDKLQMDMGEKKIILEFSLKLKDNKKNTFGFILLPIKPTIGDAYFNTVTFFTPNPGLFDHILPE